MYYAVHTGVEGTYDLYNHALLKLGHFRIAASLSIPSLPSTRIISHSTCGWALRHFS
jgi:hypothetical protein